MTFSTLLHISWGWTSGAAVPGTASIRALQSQLLVAGRVLVEALATRQPLVLAVEDIR